MQFQLLDETTAKVIEVDVLSDKDREPDKNPGAALSITMTHSNQLLGMFDPALLDAFYRAIDRRPDPKQDALTGVPPKDNDTSTDKPKLTEIGTHIREVGWELELIGYTLSIPYGTGGKSDITVKDCKVTNFKLQMKEGGSVIIKFRLEAPDVSAEVHGKLALLKSQEIKMTLVAPVVKADTKEPQPNPLPFEKDGSKNPAAGGKVTQLKPGGKAQQADAPPAGGGEPDDGEEPLTPEEAFARSQASK